MGMPEIFISYIHEDEIVAKALQKLLEDRFPSVGVFVSGDQLLLGDEWLLEIRAALKSAKLILALFSPAAIDRPWVNFEAGGAWFSDGKRLVPICIGDLRPENLPKPYSNIQGASLESEAWWYIIQDLWKVLDLKGTPPPPFVNEAVKGLNAALSKWKVERERIESRREEGRADKYPE
jgi:TIR domain